MTEGTDRYLDSSRVLRELEEAERKHQLDHQGVLDELARAVSHCDRQFEHHSNMADAYMLARAAYFAEAHRRTVLSRVEVGLRGSAIQNGRPDPVAKEGFSSFCARTGVSDRVANRLAKIGLSANPKAALDKSRKNAATYASGRNRGIRDSIARDPLLPLKQLWFKLSPVQRTEFLRWAVDDADKPLTVVAQPPAKHRQDEARA